MTYRELLESLTKLTPRELDREVDVAIDFEEETYSLLSVNRDSEGNIALRINY